MAEASIYDQLAKESFSDLTITQLNAGTSVTAVDQATINYWKGPLTLSRVLEASRTYAGGTLPIPESGSVALVPVLSGADADVQPSGTEIWVIKAIHATASGGTATCTLSLTDGITVVPIKSSFAVAVGAGTIIDINDAVDGPLLLSNALYLNVIETGGANAAQFALAYFKMGL